MVCSISASRIPAAFAEPDASEIDSDTIAMTATTAAMEEILVRKGPTFILRTISRLRPMVRQLITVLGAGIVCVACGSDGPPEGQVGFIQENFGGVVSDEPRSALVGRDVLSAGGTAVDAAVATYFAMAVTYPGAATLGGGGICVVSRGGDDAVEAIDFRPALFVQGNRAVMIPGAVRGMFALHARYGRLKWEALLLPAERLARFGNPVSRAFARQTAGLPDAAFADPAFRRIFAPRGKALAEGEMLRQEELSATLAGIRLRGPGEFYAGDLAATLARELGDMAGITVPTDAFRAYRPTWTKTEIVNVGNDELHLPGGPDGERAAVIWRALSDKTPLPADAPQVSFDSAGFVATDRAGGAAACVVSANGTVGAGRIIGHSGIVAAAPPRGDAFPGLPMVMLNRAQQDARGVAAGSGGAAGIMRVLRATAPTFGGDSALDRILSALPVEGGAAGRVNIIYCPEGVRRGPASCRFQADPGGHGLATSAAL